MSRWRRLALLVAAALSAHAGAQPQAVADGAWWLPGSFVPGRQPDANSLLLQGRDGLVVVDSGRHVEHAQAIVDWARQRGQPLRHLVNTHWHLDHVGGNTLLLRLWPDTQRHGSAALRDAVHEAMPRSQTELGQMAADPKTPTALRRMVEIDLALYAQRLQFVPDHLVTRADDEADLAGRRLRIGLERGPTRGDVWVLDVASGVLAVGDFVTLPVPFFDTACAADWQAALARLQELPFRQVLPGHGPLLDRSGFVQYRRAFDALLACAKSPRPAAECADEWSRAVDHWLDDGGRRNVRPMLLHYLAQNLRADTATRQRHCAG